MSAVRPFRHRDLGLVVGLWGDHGPAGTSGDGLTVDEAIDLITTSGVQVLVAERHGQLVGVAIGAVTGPLGVIHRVSGDEQATDRLLEELEVVLAELGARKLIARAHAAQPLSDRLLRRGFRPAEDVTVCEREVPATTAGPRAVSELGGQLVSPGLWQQLEGMEQAKRLIERRVILPLEEPALAARHGVSPPRAIVLFGPPGTGKTTFAKGVASRLGWPFIPIEPAQLSEEGVDQESHRLARTFDRLLELPSAVAFVDEVEEIASTREEERKVTPRVTTEFLRQVPRLRHASHHVLVCATNVISRLDAAFLRPGRFDHVLPVGPPDDEARAAIWRRYVSEITGTDVDVDALVAASTRFTAADIEFAAGKAAQMAFEREYSGNVTGRATTEDFLVGIEQTPPTLTPEMVEVFERDVERFART